MQLIVDLQSILHIESVVMCVIFLHTNFLNAYLQLFVSYRHHTES